MKNPFEIIKSRYVTEKAAVLEKMVQLESNKSLARCKTPKYVFIVDIKANKKEIASALMEIYKEKNIKVLGVNTLIAKRKPKRRGRSRPGETPAFKKAVVTLAEGCLLENV